MLSFFFFKCHDGQVSHFVCSVAEGGGQLHSSKSYELSKALRAQKNSSIMEQENSGRGLFPLSKNAVKGLLLCHMPSLSQE